MHGLTPEEEIDYWRERARRAEAAGAWKPSEIWREEVADEVAELSAEDVEALRWARECIVRGLKRDSCYDADGNPPPGFTMISRALAVLERLCGGKEVV